VRETASVGDLSSTRQSLLRIPRGRHWAGSAPSQLLFERAFELYGRLRAVSSGNSEGFRRLVVDKKCQFIIATHAPALLDEFRDQPEAILLFRRGPNGSIVRPLTKVPDLVKALDRTKPGEMLASGFFNDGF
jgi:hypothetical protein